MNAQSINRAEFFTVIGRAVIRSKVTWVLIAITIAALGVGLAIVCWEMRGFIGAILSLGLVYFGFRLAWELLPFSERTRARWAYQDDLSERYFSYRWRNIHWLGLSMLTYVLWGVFTGKQVNVWDFFFPTLFTVQGLLANWYWNRNHAHKIAKFPS